MPRNCFSSTSEQPTRYSANAPDQAACAVIRVFISRWNSRPSWVFTAPSTIKLKFRPRVAEEAVAVRHLDLWQRLGVEDVALPDDIGLAEDIGDDGVDLIVVER